MPSSRASRKTLKQTKTVTAAEWRLRAEMGADLPVEDTYVSPAKRQQMKRDRDTLRAAFEQLPKAERKRRAAEFKRELRPLCLSPAAHKGAWDANFAPLLSAPSPRIQPRPPSRKQTERPTGKPKPAAPHASKPAKKPSQKRPARSDPVRAARALDVKLRETRPSSDGAVSRLVNQLNSDRHFLEAFGRPVTAADIRKGLETVGQYRGAGTKKNRRRRRRKAA